MQDCTKYLTVSIENIKQANVKAIVDINGGFIWIKNSKWLLLLNFKGGVGRTQLMLNSAKHLASKGKKVLMVDLDVHAWFELFKTWSW